MKIKTRRYYIYYLAVIGGSFIAILPLKLGLFLAELIGNLIFSFPSKDRQRALDNLKFAFPEKPEAERREIARQVFVNLSKNAVEWLNVYKLKKHNLHKWIRAEGFDKVERAFEKGKGVIIMSPHFGNWELMSFYLSFRYPSTAIARRIYFDGYDRFINKMRASKGVKIIYRDESPKKFLRALKNNEAVGLLADQDVDNIDGVFVDFFGRSAYTPKAPVAFAMASGAPLFPCFLIREKDHHRLVITDPIYPKKDGDREATIKRYTQEWTRITESYIRKYPGYWVWIHRRWKTRPEDVKAAAK